MLTITYQSNEYKIHIDNIPEHCYLYSLIQFNDNKYDITLNTDVHLDIIVPLLNGTLDFTLIESHEELIPILDFHNLDIYDIVYNREQYIRDNLYADEFVTHEMNIDPQYKLIELTEDIFNMIAPDYEKINLNPHIIYESTLTNRTWADAHDILQKHQVDYTNTVIAGGAVFSALFESYSGDVDLFIYGIDEQTALSQIKDFIMTNNTGYLLRTTNSLTFYMNKIKYQYILRLYKHKHEIIHGFDIDSCCCMYDGEKIWVTERFMLAITRGYNQINLRLLSPSYGYRLAKYHAKGMRVLIPGFTRKNVIDKALYIEFAYRTGKRYRRIEYSNKYRQTIKYIYANDLLICDDIHDKYHNINTASVYELQKLGIYKYKQDSNIFSKKIYNDNTQMSGLDILLFIEYMSIHSKYKHEKTIDKLSWEHSDYDSMPNVDKLNKLSSDGLRRVLHNMWEDIDSYLDEWDKVFTLSSYEDIINSLNNIPKSVTTNNFPSAPIYYIGMYSVSTSKTVSYIKRNHDYIFDIPDTDYQIYKNTGGIILPQHMRLKKINPGEQMTNTFNVTVLEDNDIWYNGKFYHL